MEVEPQCLDEHGAVAMGALATLGDMAMQTSLLSAYPGQRLTTMLLQVRRYGLETCRVVDIAAEGCNASEQAGFAHATLKDDRDALLGISAAPSCRSQPRRRGDHCPGKSVWNALRICGPVAKATFQNQEIALVKGLTSLLDSKTTRFSDLIKLGPSECSGKQWRCCWKPATHLLNRAGEVQGGAVFGALSLASKLAAPNDAILLEHKVQFFKLAWRDVDIEIEPLHEGRRFISTISRMLDPERGLVALGWSQITLVGSGADRATGEQTPARSRPPVLNAATCSIVKVDAYIERFRNECRPKVRRCEWYRDLSACRLSSWYRRGIGTGYEIPLEGRLIF